MKESFNLSVCQEQALKQLTQSSENIFLTGFAGSGKSFLIRHFLKDKDRKTFPVVASTGVAAVLIGGRTFHSFFGLGIMEGGVAQTIKRALEDTRVIKRLKKVEGFILDEVSMVSGPTLMAAEAICREARKKDLPWGGARIITVGDFAQLPPVNPYASHREWAFLEDTWEKSAFVPLILKTIMRTVDHEYSHVLNAIREGIINKEVRDYLDSKVKPLSGESGMTHLFPHRQTAEEFNLKQLLAIKKDLKEIPTTYLGNARAVEMLKKQAPIPENLQLKESALVMLRVNDPQLAYVNGSLGHITKISDETLTIKLKNKREVEIEKTSFSLLNADGQEVAAARNFPVTLAYATTIHKAQGATLDAMVCDLRKLWEPGQAYVALSRLKSGDGLTLMGWDEQSIRVDPQVVAFHRSLSNY
ncbi:MAG: hypothetical protein ACD_73C00624G0002 [uncultured bacterium]|nr:MAG: hypothetical protein ACD_73C00624G0002 [uncultured bacterium]